MTQQLFDEKPIFRGRTGSAEPKIGSEEFISIATRFGFDEATLERFRDALRDARLPDGGPNLARYMCPNPPHPAGEDYEALAREFFGVRYAQGVSSGTGSVHAALVGLGAGPGTEVICPATGFLATSVAAVLAGATPVFCDVDESMQIDPAKIEPLITDRTVAVLPTHHFGVVADMDAVVSVARRHNLKVLEDCAQSPGGSFRGQLVGTIGDVGAFSVSCYKIIGGGEGGLLITDDKALFERAQQLIECGGFWRPDRFAAPRYEGELFVGSNYRMSELEAAVDVVQLRKLPAIVSRYRDNFHRVATRLQPRRGIVPQKLNDPDGIVGYQLRFFPESYELAARIADDLRAARIPFQHRGRDAAPDWHVYRDMYPLASHWDARNAPGACPVAEDLFDRTVVIEIDQWWSPGDAAAAAEVIDRVLARHCEADAEAPGWLRA